MRVLCLNGPNLNLLGRRDPTLYGVVSLAQIEEALQRRGDELGAEVACFQSNSEGALIDYLQDHSPEAHGLIVNPGALTHYGLSLRDALVDTGLPLVEVHLSNIYNREPWRSQSVVAPIALGQISGLGWRGYLYALEFLAFHLKEESMP